MEDADAVRVAAPDASRGEPIESAAESARASATKEAEAEGRAFLSC